jgi:hypothetical protein
LAWTRTLGLLRKALKVPDKDGEMEGLRERMLGLQFGGAARTKGKEREVAGQIVGAMVAPPYSSTSTASDEAEEPEPSVTYIPTLTGGSTASDLQNFYSNHFLTSSPTSLRMKLLSRTTGVDRIIDEFLLSFTHTHPIPWLLPSIPRTNKPVQVPMVSVVAVRGGQLVSERVYWDQASVLVQIGLLDPVLGVPKGLKGKGMERLPAWGSEQAEVVRDARGAEEAGLGYNELLPGWKKDARMSASLPSRARQSGTAADGDIDDGRTNGA